MSIMLKSSQIPRAVQSSKLYKILLSVFLASLISDFFACVTPLAGAGAIPNVEARCGLLRAATYFGT